MKTHLLFSGLLAAGVLLTSCEDTLTEVTVQDQAISTDGRSKPAAYESVNIDLLRVEVSKSNNQNTNNWTALPDVQPGMRNLMAAGTLETPLLNSAAFQTGTIKQVRLILGKKSTVKLANGRVYPLDTPSGQTSGLKVKVNTPVTAGRSYALLVTIDPNWQVVYSSGCSDDDFTLKPVLTGTLTTSWDGGQSEARTAKGGN